MHDFAVGFSHLWYVPTIILALCVAYVSWKMKGGTLLFKLDKKDDGVTVIWKMIGQFFTIYIGTLFAIVVGIACVVWLIMCAAAGAFA